MEDRPRHEGIGDPLQQGSTTARKPHHPQVVIAVEETAAQSEMNKLHARRRKGMEIRTGPTRIFLDDKLTMQDVPLSAQ
jgi:hypothetical protein